MRNAYKIPQSQYKQTSNPDEMRGSSKSSKKKAYSSKKTYSTK